MAFKGRVVLITGASSGIGAATAVHFSLLGASLSLTGRNEENLNKVAEQCQTMSDQPKPYLIIGDVTNESDAKNILESTIKHFGKLDILINNAGILESGSIENTSLEQYDKIFNTNVRSIYHLTMLAVPHLIKTKGNIVNVSSVAGLRSFPGILAYCMSKSTVDQFTKCIALELAPKQIRVNSVNPGVIVTEIHKRGGMDLETYEKFLERSKETHALGRPGKPDEVARAIAFLASDDASFITAKLILYKNVIRYQEKKRESVMAFKGKVVLVTGASSGIGAATAVHFSRLGASLSLTGRNAENLTKIAEQCQTSCDQPKPFLVTGDLTNEKDTKNILESTITHFGKLDVLINNAGVLEAGSIENTSLEQYDKMFNTNVRSIYHLTMLAVPHLIKTKGNIVNVSSVNGLRSFPGVLAYCMSKSAVDQFTRCTALELAPKQVRVNSVNPGVIVTELQKRGGMNLEAYEKFLERSKETHALGRPGKPDEVARAIAFLASDDASFITGETVPVDGGRHAMCPR
ncbi:hypothetical protein L9F63_005146 [Diploptera punctata]|uniref:Ketoreductase domain-containing protein n=1 Tax=Diploptera punctata TaxID=6984 RepID=A0AAD7ZE29_DIPPU|nr:hypothetical protein L9F63_005146 [Diploptera punctata]